MSTKIHVNNYGHGLRDVWVARKCQLRRNFATIDSWASFGKTTRAKGKYCLVSSATSTTLHNSKVLYKCCYSHGLLLQYSWIHLLGTVFWRRIYISFFKDFYDTF